MINPYVRKVAREMLAEMDPEPLTDEDTAALAARPVTRADCMDGHRPCPWVGCRHHLYLDVNPATGAIKINFPDLEPWELGNTCSLDVAARAGLNLEETGEQLGVTRQRVQQLEHSGLRKLQLLVSHDSDSPLPDIK